MTFDEKNLMSVIIITPDTYETIRKTVKHLRAQTVRDKLELIIAAPSLDKLGLDESELKDFFQFHVVEVGEISSVAQAKANAVRIASAPIIVFAEDHCYPDPNWASALIAAHQQGFAAVGPAMKNANPNTMLSWAGMFLHFGHCFEPGCSRVTDQIPWHNISYRRQHLIDYGDNLASKIIIEGILLDELKGKGYRTYLESSARTYHVNISTLRSWIGHAFWGGRLFAAVRAQEKRWSPWRRLLYSLCVPLIPLVRLKRTIREIQRVGKQRELMPWILPALISGLIPHAVGESIGYIFGLGNSVKVYSHYEMGRIHHVTQEDREMLLR